jgi:acetyl esterase/lipase
MTVDPQIAALLERVNAARPLSSGTPDEGREAFRALNVLAASVGPRVEVGSVEDTQVAGAAGPIRARIYRPEGSGSHPTLLFIHGGGFVIGDLDAYDAQCRVLCAGVGAVVVSVDYRLAPEAPFPAAVEDALAAMEWVAGHVDELGGDAARLAIGGDSAGGNLSAGVAQAWRGREPALAAQLLIYPITDMLNERPSVAENAEGLLLTRDDMEWFHGHYLGGDEEQQSDPRASPALTEDLSGLPPTIVVTAQYDPLRDDGDAYAAALEAAGVRVIHRRFDGLVHGFFALGTLSHAAGTAVERVCEDLRDLLR